MTPPHGSPPGTTTPATQAELFQDDAYTVRRKVFKLLGAAFHLLDARGNVIGYSRQKAFKLKEDIRVYTNEAMEQELLVILARSVLDFSATYDVVDPRSGNEPVGSLRRKGLKSAFVRDEWLIFSRDGQEIGLVQEESGLLGILRRTIDWVNLIVPQKYRVYAAGTPVARLSTNFNPFVYRLAVAFSPGMHEQIDPRLVLAASVLVAAIEGRQG